MLTSSNLVAEPDERILCRGIAPPQAIVHRKRIWRDESERGETQRRGQGVRLGACSRILGCMIDLFGMWLYGVVEGARQGEREPREEQGEEE